MKVMPLHQKPLSGLEWLQCLVSEIHALAEDYSLSPFRTVGTLLASDALRQLGCYHEVWAVGVNCFDGPPRAACARPEDLPATEAEMRDWFERGGTYQSAGYGTGEPEGADPYWVVVAGSEYLLDLSCVQFFELKGGGALPPLAIGLGPDFRAAGRWFVVDVAELPLFAFEALPPADLGPEGRHWHAPEERADAFARLWERMAWYGWPSVLAPVAARGVRGRG